MGDYDYDEISRLKEDVRSLINRFLMNQPRESADSNMYACLHSCAADLDSHDLAEVQRNN